MSKPVLYSHSNDRYAHRTIAERALGRPLPKGVQVHRHDGVRTNNDNSNLVICESQSYHFLLHARMRIVEFGADPNTHKICSRCRKAKNRSAFYRWAKGYDGLTAECRHCVLLLRSKRDRRKKRHLRIV